MADDALRSETGSALEQHARGRALTVTAQAPLRAPEARPLAGFVAQLIACRQRVPAYRRSGRIEAGERAYDRHVCMPARGTPGHLDVTA